MFGLYKFWIGGDKMNRKWGQQHCLEWHRTVWALGVPCPEFAGRYGNFGPVMEVTFFGKEGGGLQSDLDAQAREFAKFHGLGLQMRGGEWE